MFLRVIIVFLFSALIGGAAFAASSPPPKEEKSAEEESEFVPVPPISVAMYNRRNRPTGTMTVQMQLKIDDKDQRAEAQKVMPRLKNAYMQTTLKLAMNFFDINKPINANILSRSLQNATNQVLKHDKARVLIGDIAVQKRRR